jgi:peptide/nickel transport system permease protein
VTALSKGLSRGRVVVRHGLPNALIPLITVIAIQVPLLLGGAVVIEQIFAIPGIGQLVLDSIQARNYPIVLAFVMGVAILVLACNLIADILYAVVDPRIRV